MPALDYATLYDFEGQIEPVVQIVLQSALSDLVTGVFISRDTFIKDAPRVEAELIVGQAMKQRRGTGAGANYREIPMAFEAELKVRVITSRELNGNQHGQIRGIVRYTLSAGAQAINSVELPYLQIMEMIPAGASPRLIDEKQQDISELSYHLWFAIQNDAWPV